MLGLMTASRPQNPAEILRGRTVWSGYLRLGAVERCLATKTRNPLFPVGSVGFHWLRGRDLNPRPLGYEPNELPDCSTPRHCGVTEGTAIIAMRRMCVKDLLKLSACGPYSAHSCRAARRFGRALMNVPAALASVGSSGNDGSLYERSCIAGSCGTSFIT